MPGNSYVSPNVGTPSASGRAGSCAFCQGVLPPGKARQFRGEPLCDDCAKLTATTQRRKRPASEIARRAAEIDTSSMSSNRVVFAGIGSLVLVAGSIMASILVYHGTRDTWERDNADKVLALVTEAQALLDGGDQVAALAKYEQLIGLVGGRALEGKRVGQAAMTARKSKREIEQSLTAEENRRRKGKAAFVEDKARKRREAKFAEQRRREGKRRRQEEARRRELARTQEEGRLEREARDKPIEISDIGVKLVDIPIADWDWCNYSWKTTITNRTSTAITLTVVLTLYDDEGFVLESDHEYSVVISAGASKVVSSQSQMKLSVFNRAAKYGVSVQ